MISHDMKDELPGLAIGLMTLMTSLRGGHRGTHTDGAHTSGPGFMASLLKFAVEAWKQSGGSMEDESELLETFFAEPDPTIKTKPLDKDERRKVSAVIAQMAPAEKKVFRIAIFIMNPEVVVKKHPATMKDGKVEKPAYETTERTGVDPRVNVMRGIAELVHDDLSNVGDVVTMLRGTGALGSENKLVQAMAATMRLTSQILVKTARVGRIEEVTVERLLSRGAEELRNIPVPDVQAPRPDDRAGVFKKIMRWALPGSFRNGG